MTRSVGFHHRPSLVSGRFSSADAGATGVAAAPTGAAGAGAAAGVGVGVAELPGTGRGVGVVPGAGTSSFSPIPSRYRSLYRPGGNPPALPGGSDRNVNVCT